MTEIWSVFSNFDNNSGTVAHELEVSCSGLPKGKVLAQETVGKATLTCFSTQPLFFFGGGGKLHPATSSSSFYSFYSLFSSRQFRFRRLRTFPRNCPRQQRREEKEEEEGKGRWTLSFGDARLTFFLSQVYALLQTTFWVSGIAFLFRQLNGFVLFVLSETTVNLTQKYLCFLSSLGTWQPRFFLPEMRMRRRRRSWMPVNFIAARPKQPSSPTRTPFSFPLGCRRLSLSSFFLFPSLEKLPNRTGNNNKLRKKKRGWARLGPRRLRGGRRKDICIQRTSLPKKRERGRESWVSFPGPLWYTVQTTEIRSVPEAEAAKGKMFYRVNYHEREGQIWTCTKKLLGFWR